MAAIKATKEQVFKACDLLITQNKKVTVDAVLRLTKGSKSTVAPFVKNWREENPDAGYNPNNFVSMPSEVVEAFKKIWTQAVMQTEQMIDNDIIALQEERINQLEIEKANLEEDLVGYNEMKGRVGTLEEQVERSNAKIAELSEQIGHFKQMIEYINKKESQATSQSTNGRVIELSGKDWERDVNPSDD